MDKRDAQALLRGNGTTFSAVEWDILRAVMTAEAAASSPALAEHCQRNPDLVVKLLAGNALCSWALHTCPSLRDAPEGVQATLNRVGQYEFAACAQRKAALCLLDALAGEQGFRPLIIKGAANALLYYPKESLRPSGDVDLVMPDDATAHWFAAHADAVADDVVHEPVDYHLPELRLAGYPVETHRFFLSPRQWGGYEDLAGGAAPLVGFDNLWRPDTTVAFTLALLHFARHIGGFVFDALDVAQICNAHDFDLEKTAAFWQSEELVDLILPGLTVVDTMVPVIPDELWQALFESLSRRKQREVVFGLRLLGSRRWVKLRREWFGACLTRQPFAARLSHRFFGSKTSTKRLTGLEPTQARFWFLHFIVLPVKRVLGSWK